MKNAKRLCIANNATLVFVVLLLNACAVAPIPESHPTPTVVKRTTINTEARKQLALDLQKKNELHASEIQWRILIAIEPENAEYKNRLRVLQALINRRTKDKIQQGHAAQARGNTNDAQRAFLSALAIDPFNIEALEMLRSINKKTMLRLEETKAVKYLGERNNTVASAATAEKSATQEDFYYELGLQMFRQGEWAGAAREIGKYISSNSDDNEAREYYSLAQFLTALSEIERDQYESALKHLKDAVIYAKSPPDTWYEMITIAKEKIADLYYIEGLQAVRTNLELAVELWQKGLMFNPTHQKLLSRLKTAQQQQQNLRQIKNQ